MDNLEKILISLPKYKLGFWANLKIQFRLRRLMFWGRIKQAFRVNYNHNLFNRALATAVIVIVIFSVTSIYAYANDNVLPGDRFYPLKRVVEKIEQKIAPASAKINVVEKHSARRLEEAVSLSEQKSNVEVNKLKEKEKVSESIKKNIEAVVSNQQEIVDSINEMDDYDRAVETITDVKKMDKTKTDYLDQIINYAKTDKDEETVQKAEQAYESIDKQKYKIKNKEINREEESDSVNTISNEDNKDKKSDKDNGSLNKEDGKNKEK